MKLAKNKRLVAVTLLLLSLAGASFAGTLQTREIIYITDIGIPVTCFPAAVSLSVGSSLTLGTAFTIKDGVGSKVTTGLSWTSSNTAIASISQDVLTALEATGPITISASKDGASVAVNLMINPKAEPGFFNGGNLQHPSDVATDGSGNLWVPDDNGAIKIYLSDGTYSTTLSGLLSPTTSQPRHSATYGNLLLITDGTSSNLVTVINMSTHTTSTTINLGVTLGDIAVDALGNLRAVNQAAYPNSDVLVYSLTTGTRQTIGVGFLENPSGIVSTGNKTYIADRTSHEIKIFDNLLGVQIGEKLGAELTDPVALAISGNYLGIVDNGAKKLLIYSAVTWTKMSTTSYTGNLTSLSVDSNWHWIATDPTSGNKLIVQWQGQ